MKTSLLFAVLAVNSAFHVWPLYSQTPNTKTFDATRPITLTGVVAGLTLFRDRSYLIIDVKDETTGKTQRWAVEGNERNTLIAAGWTLAGPADTATANGFSAIAPYRGESGESIKVLAYPPKRDIAIQAILGNSPTVIGGTPDGLDPDSPFARLARGPLRVDLRELFKADRFVHGTEVTFSDGIKLLFGRPVD